MNKKILLKAAVAITIAFAMSIPASAMTTNTISKNATFEPQIQNRDIIFEDSFETYENFAINFPPWTCIDINGDPTFGHTGYSWLHEGEPYAFIILVPSAMTPPSTEPAMAPHTGIKYAAGFNNDNAGYTNDDWLISPQLTGDFDEVSFWAKSYSDQYNLERFTVSVSTTDTNPGSFTMISPAPYVIPPVEAWTQYTYDISSYSGQSIYIGIHMVSVDSWYLMIDDFQVTGTTGDTNPPITTCELDGDMSGTVYTSDVTVTLTATDDISGVAATYYKIDDGSYTEYTGPFTVSDNGDHTVYYYSIDNAQNQEPEQSVDFTILHVKITLSGGFGVKMTIENTCNEDINELDCKLSVSGGLIILGKEKTATLNIPAGQSAELKSFVLGFGGVQIIGDTGIIGDSGRAIEESTGTVLLFFVLGVA